MTENINPLEVKTDNGEIVLKQFTPEDARTIFELIDHSRDHLSQFGDETAAKYPTYESVLESITNPKNPQRLRFAIYDKNGQVVGSINLTPDKENPKTAEIGYYLGVSHTGRGYAAKAVEILTNFAFNNLGINSIYGKVALGNTASAKVLQKSGYQESGRKNGDIVLERQKLVL